MGLIHKTIRYSHPELPYQFHIQYRRRWLMWRIINLCFYDGSMWHQASEETMDDKALALEWLNTMHVLASE